tara:strand:- start:270 stop:563 length:294 start_codon:yes stop_codon:yes gene_type:complete
MFNLLAFISTIKIITIALFKNWIPILFGGLFLFLIFNFIETIWLKWFLAVMTGGAFFYSIYDDMNLFIQKKAFEKISTLDPEAQEKVMKKHRDRLKK